MVAGKAVKQALSGAKQLFDQRSQRPKQSAQNDTFIVYSFLWVSKTNQHPKSLAMAGKTTENLLISQFVEKARGQTH